jgi:hypothetical protein
MAAADPCGGVTTGRLEVMTLALRRGLAASAVALAAVAAPVVIGAPARAAEAPLAVKVSGVKAGVTVAAGGRQRLTVELINRGSKPRQVRTSVTSVGKASDAAGRRWSSAAWLEYAKAVVMLPAGGSTKRSLIVDVPAGAKAGEYAAQVEMVDAAPPAGSRPTRVAAPVVVRVKGTLKPGARLGAVSHRLVGGKSVLAFDVRNTGNRVLRPKVLLVLENAAGKPAGSAQIDLEPVYAGTTSTASIPLAVALPAGGYAVTATLTDTAAGATAKMLTADMRVGSAAPAAKPVKRPVAAAADESGGLSPLLLGGGALLVLGLLGGMVMLRTRGGGLGLHRARRGAPEEPRPAAPDGAEPLPVTEASGGPGDLAAPAAPMHLPTVFAELAAHTPPPPARAPELPVPMLVGNYTVRDILPGR